MKADASVPSTDVEVSDRAPRLKKFSWHSLLAMAALVLSFQVVSYFVPPYILPGWDRVWEAMRSLNYLDVLVTVARVLVALVASFFLGGLGALIVYSSKRAEAYLMPILRLMMAVPAPCWIIFAILWFKGIELRVAFVLIVTCGPIFLVQIHDGIRSVPRELREMVLCFRPTRWEYFTKLMLPGVVPAIMTGWKINASLAVRVVTYAELVGAVSGIGYGLLVAQELFSIATVMAWTVILVLLLTAMTFVIETVERHILRWRD